MTVRWRSAVLVGFGVAIGSALSAIAPIDRATNILRASSAQVIARTDGVMPHALTATQSGTHALIFWSDVSGSFVAELTGTPVGLNTMNPIRIGPACASGMYLGTTADSVLTVTCATALTYRVGDAATDVDSEQPLWLEASFGQPSEPTVITHERTQPIRFKLRVTDNINLRHLAESETTTWQTIGTNQRSVVWNQRTFTPVREGEHGGVSDPTKVAAGTAIAEDEGVILEWWLDGETLRSDLLIVPQTAERFDFASPPRTIELFGATESAQYVRDGWVLTREQPEGGRAAAYLRNLRSGRVHRSVYADALGAPSAVWCGGSLVTAAARRRGRRGRAVGIEQYDPSRDRVMGQADIFEYEAPVEEVSLLCDGGRVILLASVAETSQQPSRILGFVVELAEP